MHDHEQKRISRRDILGALTAAGAAAVAGACGSSSPTSPTTGGGTTTTTGGTTNEMATLTGSPSAGYTASLQIGI